MRILVFMLFVISSLFSFAIEKELLKSTENLTKNAPRAFEENRGQVTGADSALVKYFYKNGNTTMFLMETGIAYQMEKIHYPEGYKPMEKHAGPEEREKYDKLLDSIRRETYRMDIELLGANKNVEFTVEGKSHDYIQYYNHNTLGVHSYQKVTYHDIYPDIDWVIYKNEDGVKYDFIVHPRGDPSDIKLKTKWVEAMNIKPDGSITLVNRMGSITEKKPVSFQGDKDIETSFLLSEGIISFDIQSYDSTKALTIDPTVEWATYYGGSGIELSGTSSVDDSSNIYISGSTNSTTSISSGGHQSTKGNWVDAFLVKFNSAGVRQWATYYGGAWWDYGKGCSTDDSSNVYLVGFTESSSNISSSGHQNTYGGGTWDAFLVKFNSAGVRQWATYYGGSSTEDGNSCTVDGSNNVYLSGRTGSTNNIFSGGHQSIFGGVNDAFLVKFNSAGVRQWATYYGGASWEYGFSSAVDDSDNIYLSGTTGSAYNISSGGHQDTFGGGIYDAFLVKFNSAGVRQWATYYGGSSTEDGNSCTIDGSDNVYLSGNTASTNNIASGGHQSTIGGGDDAFLVKFNSSGVRQWATYYGGTSWDDGSLSAVDGVDNVYLSGYTSSTANIASGGHQNIHGGGGQDAFLVKFNSSGVRQWGTYYGGSSADFGYSCTIDDSDNVYLSGNTASTNNISKGGHQDTFGGGGQDAFLVKLNDIPSIVIENNKNDTICSGETVIFTSVVANGGTSPIYKWYKNRILLQSSSVDSLVTTDISNGDSIQCLLKSNKPNLSIDSAWSNVIYMVVHPLDTTWLFDTLCEGGTYVLNKDTFSESGVYRDTLQNINGCDSFIVLYLQVNQNDTTTLYDTICEGLGYIFKGNMLTQGGVYYDTVQNMNDCDSFITLNLQVNQKDTTILYDTICRGSNYSFRSNNLTQSGVYRDTILNRFGCDSFIILNFTVNELDTTILYDTICRGSSYLFGGYHLTGEGTYKDTLNNSNGCDSFVTLNLHIDNVDTTELHDTICYEDFYIFNENSINQSGLYPDTLQNQRGCDSFVILNLYVKTIDTTILHDNMCIGTGYIFAGKVFNQSGIYYDTLQNQTQCDSIVILNLDFKRRDTIVVNEIICSNDMYSFGGDNLTQSGIYRDTLLNKHNCDSFVELHLTVHKADTTLILDTICEGQTHSFFTQNLTSSGIYNHTLQNQNQCDSLLVLALTVIKSDTTYQFQSICQGDSVFFNNQYRKQSGLYLATFSNVNNCDSFIFYNLTVNSTYNQNVNQTICFGDSYLGYAIAGTYTLNLKSINGCDSIVTLNLSVTDAPARDTITYKECDSVIVNSVTYTSSQVVQETIKDIHNCDSIYRVHDIDIKSAQTIYLPDTLITFCEEMMYKNQNITQDQILSDTVRLYDEPYCDSTIRKIEFIRAEKPEVTLYVSPLGTLIKGQMLTLETNKFNYYLWNTGHKSQIVKTQVDSDFTFIVRVWDYKGCEDTASISISTKDKTKIGIPSAFSPNGDNENDVFEINGLNDEYTILHGSIYNRWGEKVYQSPTQQVFQWDGTFKGKRVPTGIYKYIVTYKHIPLQETREVKGTVTVVY